MEDEKPSQIQQVNFLNDGVFVGQDYNGATPLHAAICFLQRCHSVEESQVLIFTPKEDVYKDDGTANERQTRLFVDDWLMQTGRKGRIARLLNRIHIVRVADLVQLAVCLAIYPSSTLHQEVPNEALMVIIHDMSLLPLDSARRDTPSATGEFSSQYLRVVGHGLSATQLCKNKRQLVVLDSRMDLSSMHILQCYLQEEHTFLHLPTKRLTESSS